MEKQSALEKRFRMLLQNVFFGVGGCSLPFVYCYVMD